MGKFYRKSQHNYLDYELGTALKLADVLGRSPAAITKAKKAGKLDTFENSEGKEMYHIATAVDQFRSKIDRRHVTVATIGQKRAGFSNEMAQSVAHDPKYDNPDEVINDRVLDFGEAMEECNRLEVSKAQKEYNLARLAKLKADELEGKLVPKQECANRVYQLAANVQDKLMNIYNALAPEIVGYFSKRAAEIGIDAEKISALETDAAHSVGEMIRRSCLSSLREIAEKTKENILDG